MFFRFRAPVCVCFVICCYISAIGGQQDIISNDIDEDEILSKESPTSTKPIITTEITVKRRLVCPGRGTRIPFFSLSCKSSRDCSFLGANLLCCYSRCIKGVQPPKPEPSHAPLFGFIERVCPIDPMPELLAVQECRADSDCGPRICCPERPAQSGTGKSYCRNASPRLNRMPRVQQFLSPLKNFASYLQCTPAPPPFLDLFPKPCEAPFDCFPSLCCQENGKKFCRPPKKSLLTLIVTAAQNIGTSSFAKGFIQRIS